MREVVESFGNFVRVYEVYEIHPWRSGECQVNYLPFHRSERDRGLVEEALDAAVTAALVIYLLGLLDLLWWS